MVFELSVNVVEVTVAHHHQGQKQFHSLCLENQTYICTTFKNNKQQLDQLFMLHSQRTMQNVLKCFNPHSQGRVWFKAASPFCLTLNIYGLVQIPMGINIVPSINQKKIPQIVYIFIFLDKQGFATGCV